MEELSLKSFWNSNSKKRGLQTTVFSHWK